MEETEEGDVTMDNLYKSSDEKVIAGVCAGLAQGTPSFDGAVFENDEVIAYVLEASLFDVILANAGSIHLTARPVGRAVKDDFVYSTHNNNVLSGLYSYQVSGKRVTKLTSVMLVP